MSPATERFDLRAFLAEERAAIEQAIERLDAALLIAVPDSLATPIRYALAAGGKRLRPILCAAAYQAIGQAARPHASATADSSRQDGIHELACSLELIHCYSLVHDDLPCMDDDDLRRGRPTVHRVFGEARAVLAGAALIPLACLVLERSGRTLGLAYGTRAELVRELCTAAGAAGMVGGQQLDIEAEGRAVSREELETLHHSKTGALLTAAARLGGIAAEADEAALRALDAYGRCVGLAFQIADDLLDVVGRSAVIGKTAGRDRELGKATFPELLGIEAARERAHAEVDAAIDALRAAGLATAELRALARYVVERER